VSGLEMAGVVLLGTLVGLDLASVPQAMIARPLVAGLLGGAVVGNPLPGLAIGALCELFALETLPVGAARYPDWGPGTVAVGALAGARDGGILASGLLGLILVALVAAQAGGWLIHLVRRGNVALTNRCRDALDAGDVAAIRRVQRQGLAMDALRSMALTAMTLAVGDLLASLFSREWAAPQRAAQLAIAATSTGVALLAGWRLAGHTRRGLWLGAGLLAGLTFTVLWRR